MELSAGNADSAYGLNGFVCEIVQCDDGWVNYQAE